MNTQSVLMFPGQGSQKKGMGTDLFQEFRREFAEAENVLGYSLTELLSEGSDLLDRTDYAQPAIYFVNALHARREGKTFDYLAGHSLGEINALQYAGVFDLFTGLEIVRERGRLMQEARAGAMYAILGMESDAIQERIRTFGFDAVYLANINTDDQIVISGDPFQVKELSLILAATPKVRAIPLKTSGAFHSPFMENATQQFREYLEQHDFQEPQRTVVANFSAREYPADSERIRELMALQLTNQVRWRDSISYLIGLGAGVFEEVNRGTMLTRMVETIVANNQAKVH